MVFHFRLGWGRIDGAHVSFIYLNVNVYMFWFLNICQCVSECPVKCEDSRSRHSHLAFHSPNVGFPFTRRPPCCKIQQITFTTLMDPHINMQICKRPTFSQRFLFLFPPTVFSRQRLSRLGVHSLVLDICISVLIICLSTQIAERQGPALY